MARHDAGLNRFDGCTLSPLPTSGLGHSSEDCTFRSRVATRSPVDWLWWSRWRQSHSQRANKNVRKDQGLGYGTVRSILEEKDGTVWAGTADGLFKMAGDRWIKVGLGEEHSDGYVRTLNVDSRGQLFVTASTGLYIRRSERALLSEWGVIQRVSR